MFSFKAALPSPNVEQCDQNRSAWVRVSRPSKTVLGCKSSILAIRDRSGPDEPSCFLSKLLFLARMSSNVTITGQHGAGSTRPPKTSLGCKSSILVIRDRSGPDQRRCFLSILAIRERSEPDERRRFFSKLLCLTRMSSNVTKTGQHGSGAPRPPKTSLGCKSAILAIHDRSGPEEWRCFLSKLLYLARMLSNVTNTGQHGSGFLGLPKLYLVAKVQFWQFATGPDLTNGSVFFQSCFG